MNSMQQHNTTVVNIPVPNEPNVLLRAAIHRGDVHNNDLGFIITHPHPKHRTSQGTRFNTVVRFNFRGVGGSTGSSSWTGSTERSDVLAVVEYLLQLENAPKRIVIIGYSFGSAVGCSVADDHASIVGYAAISYPYGWMAWVLFRSHYPRAKSCSKPKFFVLGTRDSFTSVASLESFFAALPGPKEKLISEGHDHFWFGNESVVSGSVLDWVTRTFCSTTTTTTTTATSSSPPSSSSS